MGPSKLPGVRPRSLTVSVDWAGSRVMILRGVPNKETPVFVCDTNPALYGQLLYHWTCVVDIRHVTTPA